MYKRILLAYDGSVEGRTALREGALLARQWGAEVFLLSVLIDPGTFMLTEVALAGASVQMENDFMDVLNEGVARLRALGFDPVAKLVKGSPPKKSEPSQSRLRPILSWWAIADRALLTAGGQAPRGPISWIILIAVCWLPAMSSATMT